MHRKLQICALFADLASRKRLKNRELWRRKKISNQILKTKIQRFFRRGKAECVRSKLTIGAAKSCERSPVVAGARNFFYNRVAERAEWRARGNQWIPAAEN